MIYNETYVGLARDVEDLIVLLRNEVPMNATIEQAIFLFLFYFHTKCCL